MSGLAYALSYSFSQDVKPYITIYAITGNLLFDGLLINAEIKKAMESENHPMAVHEPECIAIIFSRFANLAGLVKNLAARQAQYLMDVVLCRGKKH